MCRLYFPTFGRGLSLRQHIASAGHAGLHLFPRLWVGTFIEASLTPLSSVTSSVFPRLRVGTFIEAGELSLSRRGVSDFSAFGRGLSLRRVVLIGWHDVDKFLRFRAGTFIEASQEQLRRMMSTFSPPSGGDFH